MATWGAYFASYVKTTDPPAPAAVAEVKTDGGKDGDKSFVTPAIAASAATQVNTVILPPVTPKSMISTSSAANDGFKRSKSTAKKLYEIPTDGPKDLNQVQKSTSNAARVAKLFGYSGTASVPLTTTRVDPPKSKIGNVVAMAEKAKEDVNEKKSEIMAGIPKDLFASVTVVTPLRGNEAKFEGSEGKVELPAVLPPSARAIEPTKAQKLEEILGLGLEAKSVEKADENGRVEAAAMPFVPAPLFQSLKQGEIAEKFSVDLYKQSAAQTMLETLDDMFDEVIPVVPRYTGIANRPVENAISKRKPSQSSKINDTFGMLDFFANQAGTATANPVLESTKAINPLDMPELSANQAENILVDPVQEAPKKRSPLDKLDFFANQVDAPSMTALIREPPKKATPLDMLDFFASQAESTVSSQEPKGMEAAGQKTRFERGKRVSPSPRKNKGSLELLDFFANQAMSTISEDKPLTQVMARKIQPTAPIVKNEPAMVQRVLEQPDVPSNMEEPQAPVILAKPQEAALLPAPLTSAKELEAVPLPAAKEAQSSKSFLGSVLMFPSNKEAPTPVSMVAPEIVNPSEATPIKQDIALRTAPTQTPKPKIPQTDSKPVTFPQPQMAALAPVRAPESARNRFSSTRSSISSTKSSVFSSQRSFPRTSATSSELRSIMDVRETEVTEAAVDFRERFITYEKQAEQIRLEKEEMERERERMEKELMDIEKEAYRIAEEEAAMKKFVESLEVERKRDAANEDRKRREREARELAEQLERQRIAKEARLEAERVQNERLERERIARENAERIIREQEERERAERERELEERRKQQDARFEAGRASRQEQERKQAEIDDAKRRRMEARLQQERLAKDEAERLAAEILKFAEEAEEDRLRLEAEQAQEENLRLEREAREEERLFEEDQQKLRADAAERKRRKVEQEKKQQEENDRRTQQTKRAARERAERQRYEDEAAEEEARYAEAERRITVEAEARFAKQERRATAKEDTRIAAEENSRGRQPRRNESVPEPAVESEDEESEDEIVKAERKIQEAFAGLAKERGQQAPAPAPIKRMNTTPIKTQRGLSKRGEDEGLRIQRDEADRGFGRNNTVGARPQRRPEVALAPVARAGTTRARPQIRGGLPSGPKRRPADI